MRALSKNQGPDKVPDEKNALEYLFQEGLGCLDCRFADKEAIGKGPCCTFIRGPRQEPGSNACLNRKAH